MKQRVMTGALVAVGMTAVFAGAYFVPVVMNVIVLLLTLVAIYECFNAEGLTDSVGLMVLSALMTVLFAVIAYLECWQVLIAAVSAYLLAVLSLAVLKHERYPFSRCMLAFGTTMYAVFGFGSLLLLKIAVPEARALWMLWCLIVYGSWLSDVGGWCFGKMMGRHKLCPALSPKKTWEGLLGSAVFCTAGFIGAGFLFRLLPGGENVNLPALAITAPFFTFFELMGDLAASALKREYGVKDYGNVFPGHGGVMDRFDGVLLSGIFVLIVSGFVRLV